SGTFALHSRELLLPLQLNFRVWWRMPVKPATADYPARIDRGVSQAPPSIPIFLDLDKSQFLAQELLEPREEMHQFFRVLRLHLQTCQVRYTLRLLAKIA